MPKKLDSSERSKLSQYVYDSITNFESQRQHIKDDWIKYDRAYRVIYDARTQAYDGDSQYTSPIVQNNVETIVGRLSEAVRINEKAIDIEANPNKPEYELNKRKAEVYKQIAITQSEQQKIDDKKVILQRMATKYGTCLVKVPWLKETDILKERVIVQDELYDEEGNPVYDENGVPALDEPRVEVQEKETTTYIGAGYEVVTDLEDVYKDMFIQDMQDQPIVVHRMLVNEEFVDKQVKLGNYYKDIADNIKSNPLKNSTENYDGISRSEEVLGQSRITMDDISKEYEIFEAWATYEDKEVVITVSDNKLLGYRENPYWHKKKPFLEWRYNLVEGESYGIGAIDPVLNLWYDYNDTMNQMNDAASLVLHPVIVEFLGNVKNKQSLKLAPKTIWSEKVQGAIRVLQQDLGVLVGAENKLGSQEVRINNGMGITPLMQGTTDDLDQTYRGTKMVITQGDKKHKQRAKSFEQAMWKDWLEMSFPMNAQLLDEPFLFTDTSSGQQLKINIQDAVGDFQFKVSGVEHFFDLEDRLEKTTIFSDRTLGRPWVDTKYLDYQIADMMGIKDLNKVIIEPPPPPKAPSKPPNVTISLNPKDGVSIATTAAQILEQNGYNIDLNQALDDSEIITDRTAPTALINSGMLPGDIEEDIIETRDDDIEVDKKVELVTGAKPKKSVTVEKK